MVDMKREVGGVTPRSKAIPRRRTKTRSVSAVAESSHSIATPLTNRHSQSQKLKLHARKNPQNRPVERNVGILASSNRHEFRTSNGRLASSPTRSLRFSTPQRMISGSPQMKSSYSARYATHSKSQFEQQIRRQNDYLQPQNRRRTQSSDTFPMQTRNPRNVTSSKFKGSTAKAGNTQSCSLTVENTKRNSRNKAQAQEIDVFSDSSSTGTNYSSVSPPPPPPPLLHNENVDINVPDVVLNAKDFAYIERVSKAAAIQRSKKAEKLIFNDIYSENINNHAAKQRFQRGSLDNQKLENVVAQLQNELLLQKQISDKLKDVNRRLQDRLVLFQKQNVKNVKFASQKIEQLTILAQKPFYSSDKVVRLSCIQNFRRRQTLLRCFNGLRLFAKRQRFCRLCRRRREYEKKALLLREWGCHVMLMKIIRLSIHRRTMTCAKKCFRSWEEFIWIKRAERRSIAKADDYRVYMFIFRRCFRGWKETYIQRKREQSRRMKCLTILINLSTNNNKKTVFLAWKQLTRTTVEASVEFHRAYEVNLLLTYLSRWKTYSLREKQVIIKEREIALLSLAELNENKDLGSVPIEIS